MVRPNRYLTLMMSTPISWLYYLYILQFILNAEEPKEKELQLLLYCVKPKKRAAILKKIGLSNHAKNYQKYIVPLIEKGWLAYTLPDIPTSPNQQYVTTEKGKQVLG